MSKSYGKYKTTGICTGSNTDYYRERRKHQRRVNKHRLRNTMANTDIEDFDDKYQDLKIPKKNDWDEPTDGTYKMTVKDLEELKGRTGKNYGVYSTKNNKIKK